MELFWKRKVAPSYEYSIKPSRLKYTDNKFLDLFVWFHIQHVFSGLLLPRPVPDGSGGKVLPCHQEDDVSIQQGKVLPHNQDDDVSIQKGELLPHNQDADVSIQEGELLSHNQDDDVSIQQGKNF